MTKSSAILLGVLLCCLAFALLGLHKQYGVCAQRCESRGLKAVSTSVPPWGDDMKCICAVRVEISLSESEP